MAECREYSPYGPFVYGDIRTATLDAEPAGRGEELTPKETDRFEDICRNYFYLMATMHERFVLLGEESLAASGPAAAVRSEMQVSSRLHDCFLPVLESARNLSYGSIADALAEELASQTGAID